MSNGAASAKLEDEAIDEDMSLQLRESVHSTGDHDLMILSFGFMYSHRAQSQLAA
jgi:hypothetical protein